VLRSRSRGGREEDEREERKNRLRKVEKKSEKFFGRMGREEQRGKEELQVEFVNGPIQFFHAVVEQRSVAVLERFA